MLLTLLQVALRGSIVLYKQNDISEYLFLVLQFATVLVVFFSIDQMSLFLSTSRSEVALSQYE